jgi:hypothetical protein
MLDTEALSYVHYDETVLVTAFYEQSEIRAPVLCYVGNNTPMHAHFPITPKTLYG